MSSTVGRFYERSAHLNALLNGNPADAMKQAREIDISLNVNYSVLVCSSRSEVKVVAECAGA